MGSVSKCLSTSCLEVLVGWVLVSGHLHGGHVLLLRGGGGVNLDEAVLSATNLAHQLLVGVPGMHLIVDNKERKDNTFRD